MGFLATFFTLGASCFRRWRSLHFIKRRPQSYWIYVIVFLGPLGAIIYLIV